MQTAVIVIDGILRPIAHPDGIDPIGKAIYVGLREHFRVVLLDAAEPKHTDHWLGVHGITGYVKAYRPAEAHIAADDAETRLRLLASIRAADGADLIIESDPTCAAEEVRAGYTVMLYGKPEYALDIWDPTNPREPRPWGDIVNELDRQRALKAADTRLKEIDD
ncbi:hypothetical protein [Streptomyces luteogriseus]|uniref:hypothetical protein n=1 Tax=Streptomyces luteogriseus TaxID=68233 RepID=UPI0037B71601